MRAEAVTHRGPTLGYRITDGDTTLCYIPDHEPALGAPLEGLEPEWISGYDLACGASLLIHDCQYTDDEYLSHVGWGHPSVAHVAAFARRTKVDRLMMFHHHPGHDDDELETMRGSMLAAWRVEPERCIVAAEGAEIQV